MLLRDSSARLLCCAGAGSDVDEELSKYRVTSPQNVTALNCCPLVRKLYIEENTGLPASAAVDREIVFAGGGGSFLSSAI